MTSRTVAALVLAGAAAAGCRSHYAAHEHGYVVYEVVDAPYAEAADAAPARPAPSAPPSTPRAQPPGANDPETEAARRRWIEENYGPPRAVAPPERVVYERYVPAYEVPRERVVVVDRGRDSYDYWPPIALGFSWFHGRGHHRGWGWSGSWGWGRRAWDCW